jgi:hypothetical protein
MASEKIPAGRGTQLGVFHAAFTVFSGPLHDQYGLGAEEADEFARRVSKVRNRGISLFSRYELTEANQAR